MATATAPGRKPTAENFGFSNLSEGEKRLINGAKIGNFVDLVGLSVTKRKIRPALLRKLCFSPEAVTAYGIRVSGAIFSGMVDLNGIDISWPLYLDGTTIPGLALRAKFTDLSLRGSTFKGGIDAQGCQCRGLWSMDKAIVEGQFNLAEATICGQFNAHGATFRNLGAVAIAAYGVSVNAWFLFRTKVEGQIILSSAIINSQFNAIATTFRNPGAIAIAAHGLSAKTWLMRSQCTVQGAIDLSSADIGTAEFADLKLTSCPGFAIRLDKAAIKGQLWVDAGFSAEGAIILDNADLAEARVNFRFAGLAAHAAKPERAKAAKPDDTITARLHDRHRRNALSAIDARFGRLILPEKMPLGIVNLSRARIGTLEDFTTGWPKSDKRDRLHEIEDLGKFRIRKIADIQYIVLDGATYDFLEHPDGEENGTHDVWQRRRDWLYGQNDDEFVARFNPQPWRQLAKTLTAQGFEQDARQIAVARRAEQRLDRSIRWPARAVNRLLHILGDYGFNPWKSVGWGLLLIAGFGWIFAEQTGVWGNSEMAHGFIRTNLADVVALDQKTYPPFNPWIYSLDTFIPVLNLGMENFWRPASFWLYAASIIEQIIGAFLVALSITGFTGLLTRDEPSG